VLEDVPIPSARRGDAVIRVEACGLVPNLANVLAHWEEWFPYLPLPRLPASFGLDVAGVVTEIDDLAGRFKVGDRVYVSPGLTCGTCPACCAEDSINCHHFTFRGYFGFGPKSQALYDAYPHGGMSEYINAPIRNLIALPDCVSFAQGARFGYLGTGLACLNKIGARPGKVVLINGITGTLGLGACLVALAMGVTRILGVGRNPALIKRVEALAPGRIKVLGSGAGTIAEFARAETQGYGVDGVVDCLAPGAPGTAMQDAIYGVRRGGALVNANGVGEPTTFDIKWMQAHQVHLLSNNWFSNAEGQMLAAMAEAGTLDLSVLQHVVFSLNEVNAAIGDLHDRSNGGFSNFLVVP
jgi:alcohol dehydrogenase